MRIFFCLYPVYVLFSFLFLSFSLSLKNGLPWIFAGLSVKASLLEKH